MTKLDKEKLLTFIKKEMPSCLEVLSYKINDYDGTGEDGEPCFAGENITANCIVECPDTPYSVENLYGRKKKRVQVKTRAFNAWLEKTKAIKILD